jgi:C-3',4' desaturase CrtD
VIGAGNGGLTTAVMLARAGLDVTVLEAHTYPGGCAGTFRRKRYRFEAGATLAGGFNPGEVMDIIAKQVGIPKWKAHFDTPAMTVHLTDGTSIPRYGDERRWDERREAFGDESLPFWNWQERTADALWDFASRSPPFPPQGLTEIKDLLQTGVAWASDRWRDMRPSMARDAFLPLAHQLRGQSERLRQFIDAQLLISAQTISKYANSLFSASALDLPRRGVVHMEGGIGTIARQLEEAVVDNGGKVMYRQQVQSIGRNGSGYQLTTTKGDTHTSDVVVANLTPWNLREMIARPPRVLQSLPERPKGGWGAFMVYVGIDKKYIPDDTPLHHQILAEGKLTEGNSIFISLSPTWDNTRAPEGKRAITISTHTELTQWWKLYRTDPQEYARIRDQYVSRIIALAKRVFPDIDKAELIEPGTPLTFQHFTRRKFGWVGGFRQENLFKTFAPSLDRDLWLVGDSIFPGQSTAAVSLGGLRVARSILQSLN